MEGKGGCFRSAGAYATHSICTFSRARHKEEEQISFCYSGRQTTEPIRCEYNFVRYARERAFGQEHGYSPTPGMHD